MPPKNVHGRSGGLTPTERLNAMLYLSCGPDHTFSEDDPRDFTEEKLRQHWDEWASEEQWDESHWAYHRFVLGLDADEAEEAYEAEKEREWEASMIAKVREYDVADWHTNWGDTPLAERRRLILLAGRPDLIQPETCARFGITEDTQPQADGMGCLSIGGG
jgi:hypothetical protein